LVRDKLGLEYPRNIHFKCERCAICCGDTDRKIRKILLMKLEADHVSSKTLKPIREFAGRIEGFEPYVYEMKKTEEGKCVFLEANACIIYKIRPLICRFYPFKLRANEKKRYVFSFTNECPYIGHGPMLKRKYFERLFKKSTDLMKKTRKIAK
jgi:Fe-S-cluster containining protein